MTKKTSIVSIIPLLIFVAIFLGSGIYFDNFYSLPAPIIALFAVVVALLIYRAPLNQKIALFFRGAGNSNVLQMCVIALLAGAFASVAKASGSIDSIVNMGMYYISPRILSRGYVCNCLFPLVCNRHLGRYHYDPFAYCLQFSSRKSF